MAEELIIQERMERMKPLAKGMCSDQPDLGCMKAGQRMGSWVCLAGTALGLSLCSFLCPVYGMSL